MSRRYDDHDEVLDWLRDNIEEVVEYYCPDAKRRGSDLRWDDGRKSVKITGSRRGAFRPFNETDHAMDPVGFVQWAIGNLHDPDGRMKAFDEARAVFGIGRAEGERLSEEERQRIREEAERKRAERAEQERKDQEEARAWAHARFTEAQPIEDWQPYLNATRGLFLPQWPACVRFHPACPTKPGGTEAPCILLALQGPWRTSDGQFANNAFMAIQRIYLSDDHTHKRDWKAAKLNYGPSSGALIHLTRAEYVGEDLGICEGLENGLSLQMMVGEKLPIWAATGTSNLSNAALPPQVKRVTIFADWDEEKKRQDGSTFRPGQDAAERLRDKCLAEGRAARIVYPNVFSPGEDWNDWIRRDQGELKRGEVTEQEIVEADEEFWQERVEATPFEQPAEAPETEAADNALQPADDGPPEGHPAADAEAPADWADYTDPSGFREPRPGEYGHDYDVEDVKNLFDPDLQFLQERYVYIQSLDRFIKLPNMMQYTVDALNRTLRHIPMPNPNGGNQPPQPATALVSRPGTLKVEDLAYWPGKKRFVVDDIEGRRRECLNIWQPYHLESLEDDCTPWTRLLGHIFGGDTDAMRSFEQWLAYHIQHPGAKMHWSPLIIGGQGIGKSTIATIMKIMLGSANVRNVEQQELESQFNSYVSKAQLLVFEEISGLRRALGWVKTMITADTVPVNEKNQKVTVMANRANMLFFTNNPQPIALDLDDRRFMVFKSKAEQNPEVTDALWDWLKGEQVEADEYGTLAPSYSGVKALKRRFEQMDLSDFNPLGNAPKTNSKLALQEQSLSEVASGLRHLEEIGSNSVLPDVVTVDDVFRDLNQRGVAGKNISSGKVTSAMIELGWERMMDNHRWVTQRDGKRGRYKFWARQRSPLWRDKTPQEMYDHWVELRNNERAAEARDRGIFDTADRPY